MLIQGRCHCGNISFKLNWQPDPVDITARECTCSFCVKHGGLWTSCPTGSLSVQIRNDADALRYMFGTKTAQFHVCAKCGAVPLVTSDIEGCTFAVVSVRAFEGVDPSLIKHAQASFEGEELPARLARRARNWIPDVKIMREAEQV